MPSAAAAARRHSPSPAVDRSHPLHHVEIETRDGFLQPDHPASRSVLPGLFPRRSVNLVVGSVGSGKTTTVLTELDRYLTEGKFLTYALPPEHPPAACGAICCSGTLEILYDRIQALDLPTLSNLIQFPIRDWKPESSEITVYETLARLHGEMCRTAGRHIGLLLIEGFQLMQAEGTVNDLKAVRDFYKPVQQFCLDQDVTILGTVGSPKAKAGDRYPVLADRVLGSIAWAQEASTLVCIEGVRMDLPEESRPQHRKVIVQVRENPSLEVLYTSVQSDGRLVVIERHSRGDAEVTAETVLDSRLDVLDPGAALDMKTLLEVAEGHSFSQRSVERWVTSRVELGMLERQGNNRNRTYVKARVQ